MKNLLVLSFGIFFALASLSGCEQQSFDTDELENAVSHAVEQKTAGVWDKKTIVEKLAPTLKAAEGKWTAKDAWDWIAWEQENGRWKVLVSLDGFDCDEIEAIPAEYNNFFDDVIYQFPPGKYCYEHK